MLYNLTEWLQNWLDAVGLYPLVQVMYQLEFRAFLAVLMAFANGLAGFTTTAIPSRATTRLFKAAASFGNSTRSAIPI